VIVKNVKYEITEYLFGACCGIFSWGATLSLAENICGKEGPRQGDED